MDTYYQKEFLSTRSQTLFTVQALLNMRIQKHFNFKTVLFQNML